MNKELLKLRLKTFWRDNEKLILLIAGAFLLGVLLASANYIQHHQSLVKYETSTPQNISSQQTAILQFDIENPTLATNTQLELKFDNVDPDKPVEVYLNEEQYSEVNSETDLISIPREDLGRKNNVTIEHTGIGIETQTLTYAKVTSNTNFGQLMFVLLNLLSLLLMAAPIMYIKYRDYQQRKEMEEKFPAFLRDVVEGTRAGMSLPQSIKNTETGSYGALDYKIEKMNAQLDWGIPFEKVLESFGKDTGSPLIRRSADTIIQAYSSGGNIQDVLESVGQNIRTIKELKEERESQLYGEMITGYVVFFIFLGILIALTEFLLPNLASAQQSLGGSGSFSVLGGGQGANLQQNISLYNDWFSRLVYIQAFFSGLIIGKLSEGELRAGLKHMAILFAAGYLAVTFFL